MPAVFHFLSYAITQHINFFCLIIFCCVCAICILLHYVFIQDSCRNAYVSLHVECMLLFVFNQIGICWQDLVKPQCQIPWKSIRLFLTWTDKQGKANRQFFCNLSLQTHRRVIKVVHLMCIFVQGKWYRFVLQWYGWKKMLYLMFPERSYCILMCGYTKIWSIFQVSSVDDSEQYLCRRWRSGTDTQTCYIVRLTLKSHLALNKV